MKILKRMRLFIILALVFGMLFGAVAADVQAASASDYITVLTDSSTLPDTSCYLTMRQSNMSVVWNSSYDSSEYKETTGTLYYLYLKVKSTGTYTYEDPCDIIFTESGEIAGRAVDITVHIDQVEVYNYASKSTSTMWSFAAIGPGTWGGGANTLWFWAGGQGGGQKIDYTTHVTWSDSGEECDLSFYQCCYDIDVVGSLSSYKESWAASLDDYQKFFIYSASTNSTSITEDNMLKFTANSSNTSGTASITRTGAVGVTASSTFSGSYWENGSCGTSLEIYSTYANLNEPVKTTDTTKTYSAGDSITWEISYNLGTFYKDVFSPFESIVIKDYLPEAAEYKSAALYNSSGVDITSSAGTLTYEESENLVTYTFNEDFLNTTSNYDGTDYVVVINAEIKNLSISYELANTMYAIIDGIEFTSSTPTVEVVNPTMSIEKTVDAATYQAGDTITYTITATETTEDGTASGVVVSDTLPDTLELLSVSYDTDTGTYTNDGSGNGFTITYDSISYGTPETITVKAMVLETAVDTTDNSAENIISNTVSCQYDNAIDRGEEPITDECSVTVLEPVVSVSKAADKTTVQIGDDVTWIITVTQSTEDASVGGDLVITDVIPEGLTYNENVTVTGSSAGNAATEYDDSTGVLTVTFSEFAYGTATIQYSTKAERSAKDQTLKNCVTVTTDEPDTNYPEEKIEIPVEVFSPTISTEVVNGTITDTDDSISYGSDKLIEYEPEEGYLLESVTVDGESLDITQYPDSYTFTDVQEDHAIKVVYAKPSMSKSAAKDGEDADGAVISDGDTVVYTISYENSTGAARTLRITDAVPSGCKVMESSISDGGIYENGVVSWTITAEAYGSGSVSFSCVMGSGTQGSIVKNTASVTFEPLTGSSSEKEVTLYDTVSTPVFADPVKSVWNEDGDVTNGVVAAGDTLTYRISFTNPAAAEKTFTVTDEISDGVTLVEGGISDGGTVSEGILTWTLTLSAKESKTVTFSVTVDAPAQELTKIYNQANVLVDLTDKDTTSTNAPEDEDRTPVYVLDEPEKVVLDADGENIGADGDGNAVQTVKQSGDVLTYAISFQNPVVETKTFTVTDELPDGVAFVSADNDGNYDEDSHTVTWTLDVEADQAQTVSVKVRIRKSAEGSIIKNSALVSVDAAVLPTNTVETPVMETPSKTVQSGEDGVDGVVVASGEELTYQVEFTNPASVAKSFTVADTLPDGVSFVSADHDGVYDEDTHTVTWILNVKAGETKTVSVVVKVLETAEGEILENSAAVYVDAVEIDTNTVDTPVLETPAKDVVSEQGGESINTLPVQAGETLYYTVTFENPAESEKTAVVTDALPDGVSFVSADSGGVYEEASHTVTWTLSVAAHQEITVSVEVKALAGAEGTNLCNQASVKMDKADLETITENGTDEEDTTNNYVPVKRVLDADGNDIDGDVLAVGDTVTYQITYENSGSTMRTITITDVLPEGVEYVSSTSGGTIQSSTKGQTVTWELYVAPHTKDYVCVKVKVTSDLADQTFANSATVTVKDDTTGQEKTVTTNEVTNAVLEDADKAVLSKNGKKDLDGETVETGTVLQYQITVKNPSESEKPFVITDEIPAGTGFISADNGGTCTDSVVTWTFTLSGGETKTVALFVKVLDSADGSTVENTASVEVDGAKISTNTVTTDVENPEEETPPVIAAKTGDSGRPFLWAVAAGMAALGACGFGIYALWKRGKGR
ncbi:MAG: DUF11 domain-containing protein [Lachnospiraceae bacterium]|nr:DUF11 domain-containing protein [Lachnospiraceae bacterium]